jgi:hypothetical protein
MPYRQRFYVARRVYDRRAIRKVEPVSERGVVRFYNDPADAHDDADRRGGMASGFVVLAVCIGADGRTTEPIALFAGSPVPVAHR